VVGSEELKVRKGGPPITHKTDLENPKVGGLRMGWGIRNRGNPEDKGGK